MTTTHTVRLAVYDLSRGAAATLSRQFAPLLGGLAIDVVPHTGVEVFGDEYFYGGGLQRKPHAVVVAEYGMRPVEMLVLGRTSKTREEFHAFLASVAARFTPATYDVFANNCNHFSDLAARFLLGDSVGIPEEIVRLPDRVRATPLGSLIAPMFQSMNADMQTHFVPFNAASAASSPAAAPPVHAPPASSSPSGTTRVAFKRAGSDHTEHVTLLVPSDAATATDLLVALSRVTGHEPADQNVIFQGKRVQAGDALLKDVLGTPNYASSVTVHVSIKPGATPRKVKTLVESLTAIEAAASGSGSGSASASASASASDSGPASDSPAKTHLRALATLQRILDNIIDHPHDAKYRSVRVSNAAFHAALARLDGGVDALLALGFVRVDEWLKLDANEERWNKIVLGRKIVLATRKRVARAALAGVLGSGAVSPKDLVAKAGLDADDAMLLETAAEVISGSGP